MTVLGVKAPQMHQYDASMKVFVEVHNPTGRELSLKRLEYRLTAKSWFDSKGQVRVERVVAPGASAVVAIMVPVSEGADHEAMRGATYTLNARIFAVADKGERSWSMQAQGALMSSRGGPQVPIQVAESP